MALILPMSIFSLIAGALVTPSVRSEHFPVTRSPSALDSWAEAELKFVANLLHAPDVVSSFTGSQRQSFENYYLDFQNSTKALRGYEEGASVESRVTAITYNPLASYRMIRRLLYLLPPLKQSLLDNDAPISKRIDRALILEALPLVNEIKLEDLKDAMLSLFRTGHVYNLNTAEMARGRILGLDIGPELQAIHCYEIGKYATVKMYHVLSIEWLEEALARGSDGTVDAAALQSTYEDAIKQHDITWLASAHQRMSQVYSTQQEPILTNPRFKKRRHKNREVLATEMGGRVDQDVVNNQVNYWLLCSGEDLQSSAAKSKLFCWYERRKSPFWYIGPVKMELLSRDPDVLQIYDAIGPKGIQRLKELATPTMKRSLIVNPKDGEPPIASTGRTSVQAFVDEKVHKELQYLVHNIEGFTGLDLINSVAFQVASYTFSGHYEVHKDAFEADSVENMGSEGNRIGTFIFYLHEPLLGGQTAFTQSLVAAKPIQGSAVFWYDVHRDMTPDELTHHAACPVVYGRKWVTNRWIRYNNQFKDWKCALQPGGRFSVL